MTATDRAAQAARRYGAGHLSHDHLRLLTRVARLYHEHGVRQPQIAAQLGIFRTTVITPPGRPHRTTR